MLMVVLGRPFLPMRETAVHFSSHNCTKDVLWHLRSIRESISKLAPNVVVHWDNMKGMFMRVVYPVYYLCNFCFLAYYRHSYANAHLWYQNNIFSCNSELRKSITFICTSSITPAKGIQNSSVCPKLSRSNDICCSTEFNHYAIWHKSTWEQLKKELLVRA